MDGRQAADQSHLHVALRFHFGQPMIYSTIAKRLFVQINDSLADPIFEEVITDLEDCLNCDDWEPWDEPLPN
ncbi:MAG TPA: hypothetical protein VFU86_18720 [Terriglobales bacterium]|nr:hypothetical protein [Terriglobales bacterium]